MYNTINEDRGQSLFTTSTHTAHHWRDGYYFPSTNFKVHKISSNFSFFFNRNIPSC